MQLPQYTVIRFNTETNQSHFLTVEAETPHDATIFEPFELPQDWENFVVVDVVKGVVFGEL